MDLNISGNHIVGKKLTQASLEKGYRNDDGSNYIDSCYEPDLSGVLALSEAVVNSAMMKLKIHKHELPIQEIKTATELDLSNKELNGLDAIVIAALLPLNK